MITSIDMTRRRNTNQNVALGILRILCATYSDHCDDHKFDLGMKYPYSKVIFFYSHYVLHYK